MNQCPNCQTLFEGNYCPNCGKLVGTEKSCPKCGYMLDRDANFCNNCGYAFKHQSKIENNQKLTKILNILPPILFISFALLLFIIYALPVAIMPGGEILGEKIKAESYGNIYNLPDDLKTYQILLIILLVITLIVALIYLFLKKQKSPKLKIFEYIAVAFYGIYFIISIIIIAKINDLIKELDILGGLLKIGACPIILLVLSLLFLITSIGIIVAKHLLGIKEEISNEPKQPSAILIWLKENKRKLITISISVITVVTLLIIIIPLIFTKFKLSKVEKIELDMTKEEVVKVLGHPNSESSTVWEYYDNKYLKVYNKLQKNLKTQEQAIKEGKESLLIQLAKEELELEEKLQNLKHKYIQITFYRQNDEYYVGSIIFNKDEINSQTEYNKEIKKIEASNEIKIPIKIYYKDGSYQNTYIQNNSYDDNITIGLVKKSWQDKYGKYEIEQMIGLKYQLQYNDTYEITGVIEEYKEKATKIIIPENINGKKVTNIKEVAFEDCTNLKEVIIQEGVQSIGSSAFEGCTSLQSITLPFVGGGSSNTNFGYIFGANRSSWNNSFVPSSLKEVVITGGQSIADYAFRYCENITKISLPETLTSIGSYAFEGCTSLQNITIPSSVQSIADYAFRYCENITKISLPETLTSIGSYAFEGCTSLQNITIPSSVQSIGLCAFEDCTSLKYNENGHCYYLGNNANPYLVLIKPIDTNIEQVTINENTKIIYYSAFSGCTSLQSITIPSSVTSIGSYAFSGCTNLSEVNITSLASWFKISFGSSSANPLYNEQAVLKINGEEITNITEEMLEGVTSIGSYAFYKCTNLQSITIPSSVTSIGSYAFDGCTNLQSITIPSSVTSIGAYAFDGCTSLQSITIPSSVTSIGSSAFDGCTSLQSITIPYSVTSIGSSAFDGCTSLQSITIPSSVTSIGSYAFYGCTNLSEVNITSLASWCKIDFYNSYSNPLSVSKQAVLKINGEEITNITEEMLEGVTSIGSYAFYKCTNLQSITIPSSVTSIGPSAFDGCTNLSEVIFEDPNNWKVNGNILSSNDLNNSELAASYLTNTYNGYTWTKK